MMEVVYSNLVTAGMTITAAVLTVISWRAWHHTGSVKILLLTIGFMMFLAKGIVLSASLFVVRGPMDDMLTAMVSFDLGILLLFYFGILKRSTR